MVEETTEPSVDSFKWPNDNKSSIKFKFPLLNIHVTRAVIELSSFVVFFILVTHRHVLGSINYE